MADAGINRVVLRRETIAAIKSSFQEWWPWTLIFGVYAGIMHQLFAMRPQAEAMQQIQKQLHDNPRLFKEHPEMATQFYQLLLSDLSYIGLYMLALIALLAVGCYVFQVMYLQTAMGRTDLRYNLNDFFYWLKKMLWKYIRPILWCLIPIIGMFFYIRSMVRYVVVSPLALLRHGDELKTSWDMTEGNWWRIFRGQIAISLICALIFWGICAIPLLVLYILTHGGQPIAFQILLNLVQGIWGGVGLMIGAFYTGTVYRVLSQEKNIATRA